MHLFHNFLSLLPLSTFPDSEYQFDHFPETPLNIQPVDEITSNSPPFRILDPSSPPLRVAPPVDDRERFCVIYSASASLQPPMPPPQATTLLPPNWYKIPQKIYDHGQKQWDFIPSECISFGVNGRPGMNMRDALHKRFTGLDGRDDPVLRDATSAISCRLSVCLS